MYSWADERGEAAAASVWLMWTLYSSILEADSESQSSSTCVSSTRITRPSAHCWFEGKKCGEREEEEEEDWNYLNISMLLHIEVKVN